MPNDRLDRLQKKFRDQLKKKGILLTDEQCRQFETYYRLLVSWNEKMNLTGITERPDVYWKHFYDSLAPAFFVDLTTYDQLLDVGSGAGFPAFPLKIAFPHLRVTVVDSLKKRLTFLDEVSKTLHLNDMQTVHGRAEELGRKKAYREQYDFVTARAVARLNVLCEYCLPFTRLKGLFVAMKTVNYASEVQEATAAIARLGGRYTETHTFTLPEQLGGRSIIQIVKDKRTPKEFPRKPGTPAKQPIRS